MVHLRKLTSLVSASVLALSACASQPDRLESSARDHAEVTLGDTLFAFYLSPGSYTKISIGNTKNPAYLVLGQPDGSYQTIKTSGMNTAQLAWSEAGLFFSDEDRDYILTADGLTVVDNPKSDLQQSAFALPEGAGFVAVYNDGFTASGYANQVSLTTSEASELYVVEGNYFMNASCAGVIYGITSEPGNHQAQVPDIDDLRSRARPDASAQLLARLYPVEGGSEQVVAWRSAFDTGDLNPHAPCVDNVITFLSSYDDIDGRTHSAVVSWDTTTGEYVETPLVDGNGQPLPADYLEFHRYDGGSLRNGHLEWFATDGKIMSTEVATGVTTPRFDTGYGFNNYEDTQVVFGPTSIYALHEPFDGQTPVTFTEFDRDAGEVLTTLTLDGITEQLGVELNVRGLAVRPSTSAK